VLVCGITQLVSAVSIFDQMDTDGTEKLDRRELYEKVIQVVDQHMEGRTDRKGNKVPCTQADKDNISMVSAGQWLMIFSHPVTLVHQGARQIWIPHALMEST
jgi:hypothetical protein